VKNRQAWATAFASLAAFVNLATNDEIRLS